MNLEAIINGFDARYVEREKKFGNQVREICESASQTTRDQISALNKRLGLADDSRRAIDVRLEGLGLRVSAIEPRPKKPKPMSKRKTKRKR